MKTILSRTFSVIALATFITMGATAQSQEFGKGDKDLNVGIGFGSPWISSNYSAGFPPLSATFDMGLRDDWGPGVFGVGAYVGTAFYKWSFWGSEVRYANFLIAGRATYHYTFVENLDTYGGAVLGLTLTSAKVKSGNFTGNLDSGVSGVHDIFVGAKYYFTDNFAAYSELASGSSIPIFTLGAALKF